MNRELCMDLVDVGFLNRLRPAPSSSNESMPPPPKRQRPPPAVAPLPAPASSAPDRLPVGGSSSFATADSGSPSVQPLRILLRESVPFGSFTSFSVADDSSCYDAMGQLLAVARSRLGPRPVFANAVMEKEKVLFALIQAECGTCIAASDGAGSARQEGMVPVFSVDTYPLGKNKYNARRLEDIQPATAGMQLRHTQDSDGCVAFSQAVRQAGIGLLFPSLGVGVKVPA